MTEEQIRQGKELLEHILIENGEVVKVEYRQEKKENIFMETVKLWPTPEMFLMEILLHPSVESNIRVILALPVKEQWNGKLLATGNGGAAGEVGEFFVNYGVSHGYASVSTDMGTSEKYGTMYGKRERMIDFGYRATHEMTVAAKKVIRAFYGKDPEHSYFTGGSTGGQQALSEAQRYPHDYDGIVAFSPAYNRVRLHTWFVWNWQAVNRDPKGRFDAESAEAVSARLVLEYGKLCGGAPGDNFLTYPHRLRDPYTHQVKIDMGIFTDDRMKVKLSAEQLKALEQIYAGVVDPVTGERIYADFSLGAEREGLSLVDLSNPDNFRTSLLFPFLWAWGEDADLMNFDFHKDYLRAVEELSPILDAANPDLSEFRKAGGKLILVGSSADAIIPYTDSLNYYNRVLEQDGGRQVTDGYLRYFMIPGMGHCGGGTGFQSVGYMAMPNGIGDRYHDTMLAMEKWVEDGEAPEKLIATAFTDGNNFRGEVTAQRPVWAWPAETVYAGGDVNAAESYVKKG
ncbi:hypothetical protein B5F07_09030 [Lachnoclostridium sp. An169]|uniref:tannase/feruloyl esterase family alpha/beta hydrolase n=1 Tax=Lachnoclostridium sp. An169 TaxID=1965569 RepID=UPI000B3A2685|nr:tannase/feruloyl esterase family alpha/beta hydrolase [Lachnoclostridium sp. An169]OUP83985.1 hypothetical protein B5F07_09030 [Lachnoclostridium sp. An169]